MDGRPRYPGRSVGRDPDRASVDVELEGEVTARRAGRCRRDRAVEDHEAGLGGFADRRGVGGHRGGNPVRADDAERGRQRADLELTVRVGQASGHLDERTAGGAWIAVGQPDDDRRGRVLDGDQRRRPETAGLGRDDPVDGDPVADLRRSGHRRSPWPGRPIRSGSASDSASAVASGWTWGRASGSASSRARRRCGAGTRRRGGRRAGRGCWCRRDLDEELARPGRVQPVAGGAGATAVALTERADRLHDVAGVDRRLRLGRRRDDEPQRTAAVVDRHAKPVGECRRRLGHRSLDHQADALERLRRSAGRRPDRIREGLARADLDRRGGHVQHAQAEVAPQHAGRRDGSCRPGSPWPGQHRAGGRCRPSRPGRTRRAPSRSPRGRSSGSRRS